ncbi:hypothetical protein GCM10011335_34640 [Aureimonas glaciei]|uniref:Uncharacterized protein n=1 Tax=Aureimonas glaciei TaxID=1776957 RepID=A0A916Y2Y9_9HYPH|nr:hypothetical protein GCM10011335_34640 [Aureimonas glaciei]
MQEEVAEGLVYHGRSVPVLRERLKWREREHLRVDLAAIRWSSNTGDVPQREMFLKDRQVAMASSIWAQCLSNTTRGQDLPAPERRVQKRLRTNPELPLACRKI